MYSARTDSKRDGRVCAVFFCIHIRIINAIVKELLKSVHTYSSSFMCRVLNFYCVVDYCRELQRLVHAGLSKKATRGYTRPKRDRKLKTNDVYLYTIEKVAVNYATRGSLTVAATTDHHNACKL